MTLLKRTYALPAGILEAFEKEVPAGRRSAVLGELIGGWLEERRRARLRSEVVEGCQAMAVIYRQIEQEYHPLEEEVERGPKTGTAPRRRRSRPA